MSNLDNINLTSISKELGSLHPINQTKDYLLRLLAGFGFKEVHGPEIETEQFNFDITEVEITNGGNNFKGLKRGTITTNDGVAIDAVISDFMSGEMENLIDTKVEDDTDLIIVEGQGALSNYAYSGVTLGLIHGCMPDYFILTHDPSRSKDVMGHEIPDINELMQLHIDLMDPFKRSSFIGMNLLTFEMDKSIAVKTINEFESLYKLPTTDLIRFGNSNLIKSIYNLI